MSTRSRRGNRKLVWLSAATAFVVGWVAFLAGSFTTAALRELHILTKRVRIPVAEHWRKVLICSTAFTISIVVQSILTEAPFRKGMGLAPIAARVEASKPPRRDGWLPGPRGAKVRHRACR